MSTRSGSLLERFIRAVKRGLMSTAQTQQDREVARQEPIRWLNLR